MTAYPNVVSVAKIGGDVPHIAHIMRAFPNVQHVALDEHADPTYHCRSLDVSALSGLQSLHVYIEPLHRSCLVSNSTAACRLRCLSLRWVSAVRGHRDYRQTIGAMLALTPHLAQLSITGGPCDPQQPFHEAIMMSLPSVLDQSNPLPELTYLQFTDGLIVRDLHFLLNSTSPPAFASSLTHLALAVHPTDRPLAASLLPALPTIYPNLQRCHIALQPSLSSSSDNSSSTTDEKDEWQVALESLRLRLGAVWCDSEDAVRMARLDVQWRRNAGVPCVSDSLLGCMTELVI